MHHSCLSTRSRARAPQEEKAAQWDAHTARPERNPCSMQLEKACMRGPRPAQPQATKIKQTHKTVLQKELSADMVDDKTRTGRVGSRGLHVWAETPRTILVIVTHHSEDLLQKNLLRAFYVSVSSSSPFWRRAFLSHAIPGPHPLKIKQRRVLPELRDTIET